MILDKTVKIIPKSTSIKYYNELGYKFEKGEEIDVDIKDIPLHSSIKIRVLCDFCMKNIMMVTMNNYTNVMEKSGSYVCKDCAQEKKKITFNSHYGKGHEKEYKELKDKIKKTCLERYGTDNPLKSKEIQKKVKNTNLERYGVENVFGNDKIKNKIKQHYINEYGVEYASQVNDFKSKAKETCLKKYGTENPFQNDYVKNKYKNTCLEKYGFEYASKSNAVKQKVRNTLIERYGTDNIMLLPDVKEKVKQTNIERYGFDNPMKCKEIREKLTQTLCKNQSQKTSQQQLYLHNLYGGELNYPISYYSTDICLLGEKIVIEYDGGGHNLRVTLGSLTQEEFNKKEIIRNIKIKSEGYKQIRIISSKDYLPSDEILLKMLNIAKEYFNTTNHTWVEYNIDTSIMQNAEHKDGVYFDFGELRKIKKAS